MSLEFIPLLDIPLNNDFFKKKSLRSFELFSDYYKKYYGDNYKDLSFAIFSKNRLIGYVLCSALDSILTTPDGAVRIVLSDHLPKKDKKFFLTGLLEHLTNLANLNVCEKIIIKDSLDQPCLSPLGEILFNQRFESRLTFEMDIPFSNFSEKIFHASLRKSYKSLISWGQKELKRDFINKDNLDRGRFNEFQEFHHRISGRVTRSQETWDAQYNMLEKGLGELILATYKGQLAAGSLFSDYGDISTYFTGVYERDLFVFGVSHFILYEGILRSYSRHQTSRFSLGYFDTNIEDPKWYNIQFFKKGFCKDLTPVIFWSRKVKDG